MAGAAQAIATAGLGHRAHTQGGSFFHSPPAGTGGYVLSAILHYWDDGDAIRILQRCAEAASQAGKVPVVDHFGDARGGATDTEGDLRMLCYMHGRERTVEQLGELAASAGLQVSSVMPAGSRTTIEFRPSH